MNTKNTHEEKDLADWLVQDAAAERCEVPREALDYAEQAFFRNLCKQLRATESAERARHLIEGFRQLAEKAGKYGEVRKALQDVISGALHPGLGEDARLALRACQDEQTASPEAMCEQLRTATLTVARDLVARLGQVAAKGSICVDAVRTLMDVVSGRLRPELAEDARLALHTCGCIPFPGLSLSPSLAMAAAGMDTEPEAVELCGGRLMVWIRPSEGVISLATEDLSLRRLTLCFGEAGELPVELRPSPGGTVMLADVAVPQELRERMTADDILRVEGLAPVS